MKLQKFSLPASSERETTQRIRNVVKLHGVGPRMKMQLVKVEEGLSSGAVMFHEYGPGSEDNELMELGFDRESVTQALNLCDTNEEQAASYLFGG
ncbi:hypothetical protein R1sor_021035 [Riccia sorocarpa]|uniref:UBA domain-containing protein n=1 Tax=Riccia sorocarpa TaxID=122646 RepID=A0ABD3GLK9_9MARC